MQKWFFFQTTKMAAISQDQGRLRSNSRKNVPLTPSNVPTNCRWNNQNRFEEKCKMFFQTPKMAAIFQDQGRFHGKMCPLPLAISLPSFVRITRTFGEMEKMRFQTLEMAAISQCQSHMRSNTRTRYPLPLAMSLLSFVGITGIHMEKKAKLRFQTLIMAAISRGQFRLRSTSRTRCPYQVLLE